MTADKAKTAPVGARGAARMAAVQALYQLDMTGAPVDRVVDEFVRHRLGGDIDGARYLAADGAHFAELVQHAAAATADLDTAIEQVLTPDWPLGRLDRVIKAVLRAGCYELRDRADVPPRVVISEYVEIAKAFFSGKEPGLVNGVLDRLARRFRPDEMDGTANERT
jgi:N utilization substance protein B